MNYIETKYNDLQILGSEINTTTLGGKLLNAPNVIKFAIERVESIFLFNDYSHFFPCIDVARNSYKRQRINRTFLMAKILATLLKMTDIMTLRVGTFNAAYDWCDASIKRIADSANVSLSSTKKILLLLEAAGILETKQAISCSDVKKGIFKVSVKRFTVDFLASLGLTNQLKQDRDFKKKEAADTQFSRPVTPAQKLKEKAMKILQQKLKDTQKAENSNHLDQKSREEPPYSLSSE